VEGKAVAKQISDVRFHAEALREYLSCWESPEVRRELGVPEDEAAYHLLEHAGWLDRYGEKPSWIEELCRLPAENRKELVRAACAYVRRMNWAERARAMLSREALAADDLEHLENLLIRRDALETAWLVARRVVDDLLRTDPSTARQLAEARCVAAEIDDILASRPDAVSVAAEVLSAFPRPLPAPEALERGWWFAGVRSSAQAFPPLRFSRTSPVTLAPRRIRFRAEEPCLALAASAQPEEWARGFVAETGARLVIRAFPSAGPAEAAYTLAVTPVGPGQEVTLSFDDAPLIPLRAPQRVERQQLLYLTVKAADFLQIKDFPDRLTVELTEAAPAL
jgi:hypothetical protein